MSTGGAAQAAGIRLHVCEEGEGTPALVFLHYWGGSSRTWALVMAALGRDHLCIAPDLRGWGRSAGHASDQSLEVMADDVLTIVRQRGLDAFVLIGHSMGGKIAQLVAARRPPELRALILVAPAPLSPLRTPRAQREAMLRSYGSEAGVDEALQILTCKDLGAQLRRQVVEDTLCGSEAAKRAWVDRGMEADYGALCKEIDVAALVLVGEEDRVEPVERMRSEVSGRIARARLVTLPGVGHLAPLEAPAELAATIALFLRDILTARERRQPSKSLSRQG